MKLKVPIQLYQYEKQEVVLTGLPSHHVHVIWNDHETTEECMNNDVNNKVDLKIHQSLLV